MGRIEWICAACKGLCQVERVLLYNRLSQAMPHDKAMPYHDCSARLLRLTEAARTVTLDVTSCVLEDSRAPPQHIKLWQDSFLLFGSLAILESKPSIVVNNTSLSPCHRRWDLEYDDEVYAHKMRMFYRPIYHS
jgi:hypothetical protein